MYACEWSAPCSLGELASRLRARPGLCWLDGDCAHADARFSFLGSDPVERITLRADAPDALVAFDIMQAASAQPDPGVAGTLQGPAPHEVPRFAGYVAYDAQGAHPRARAAGATELHVPVVSFARYDAWVALRHTDGRAFLVGDDRAACERLRLRLQCASRGALRAHVGELSVTPAAQHIAAVQRALEAIAAGEVYQVNLARRWHGAFEGSALALFLAMHEVSPVPFGMYYDDGERAVMARTMERFLRFDRASRALSTRPIKGTIARAGGRDLYEARALAGDDKERAEHSMIVDLMRNDLSRVAELGSVRVQAPLSVEPFAGLSHLVSTVACRVREGVGLRALIDATFPPGSVTGAPKLAALSLIAELEEVARDVYTGAVGFIDRAGGLSLAVAIRTAIVDRNGLRYWAGGGVVSASDPARELSETELKARVLYQAIARLRPPASASPNFMPVRRARLPH